MRFAFSVGTQMMLRDLSVFSEANRRRLSQLLSLEDAAVQSVKSLSLHRQGQ